MTKITSFFNAKAGKKGTEVVPTKRELEPSSENNVHNSNKKHKGDEDDDVVVQLLSYLDDDDNNDDETIITWKKALDKHFNTSSFKNLAKFVTIERKNYTIYPTINNTWTALNICPLHNVKCVIVGQDPYHGPNQAHGLCFSVLPGQQIPPSLKNIYKELIDDPKISNFPNVAPNHGHLVRWAKQGVLLLNTVLSVRKGEANSHKKRGWEDVTDAIIRAVDRQSRKSGKGVVFLLWGKPAQAKALQVIGQSSPHKIICTSHPSPLGAAKTKAPFLKSRCFSRCNDYLKKMGYQPIDWNVDGPLP